MDTYAIEYTDTFGGETNYSLVPTRITNMKNGHTVGIVKVTARDRYAWPGGYPLFVVMADGDAMCCACARKNFGLIGRATRDNSRNGWAASGSAINWEDADLVCCNCNGAIQSAYGENQC
jgi:hypothetical protein